MNKVLSNVAATIVLALLTLPLSAQTTSLDKDFSSFEGIDVGNGFEVTLRSSDTYSARWTVDEVLGEYVDVYVTGKTLYINLNTKDLPKDIKSRYKGKKNKPTLKVEVFAPIIASINLHEDASFSAPSYTLDVASFALTMTDNTSLTALKVLADDVSISLAKKASAQMEITADKINVSNDNVASLSARHRSKTLSLNAAGSSSMNLTGNADEISVSSKGGSKIILSGSADVLNVQGQGSSAVNAIELDLDRANLTLNGASAWVDVREEIKLDLKGGSEVIFEGEPRFNIVSVNKSSLNRYVAVSKK